MKTSTVSRLAAAAAFALLAASAPASAQDALAKGEAAKGKDFATVEVTSATRKDGIITVALRFLAGQGATGFGGFPIYTTPDEGYQSVYLLAAGKKYFAMKDSEGKPLIPERLTVSIDQGAGRTLWSGRFAAPPPEVKDFSIVLPQTSPLEAIAITDR